MGYEKGAAISNNDLMTAPFCHQYISIGVITFRDKKTFALSSSVLSSISKQNSSLFLTSALFRIDRR